MQFIAGDLNPSNLTGDGLAIQEFFDRNEIPVSLIRSVTGTFDALLKMRCNVTESKNSLVKTENIEYRKGLTGLISHHNRITELYVNLKNNYLSRNSKERRRVEELENLQMQLEGSLKLWQENKPFCVEVKCLKNRIYSFIKNSYRINVYVFM